MVFMYNFIKGIPIILLQNHYNRRGGVLMDIQKIQQDILQIIQDTRLTHRQCTFALAEYAENLCDYPEGAPMDAFRELEAKRILCDHNDGHAPYAPRYILPDYSVFLEKGSEFLRLPPPRSLRELLSGLLILYMNVPSVTHLPVYGGRLDHMVEPFLNGVSEEEARGQLRTFLIQIDRIIADSFFHVNLGPEDTRSGRILAEEMAALENACPNMTLRYDPAVTSDEFAEICIRSALTSAHPAFAFDPYFRQNVCENYGIASCYNGLPVGGGAYSLSRMRLGPAAECAADERELLEQVIPRAVDTACRFMEAKIRFITEETPFFSSSFLVREGFLHPERFVGMFGLVGLNECVNILMDKAGRPGRYGSSEEADDLGRRIVQSIASQVSAFKSRYSAYGGGRFMMHAQVGACGDNGVTPGVRIAIGSEPELYAHLRQAGTMHPYFPSGIGDIFPFETTARENPAAVLDVIKGAFQVGVHYLSIYGADTDVIRVTGYLIKKSEMEQYLRGEAVGNRAVSASEETVLCRGTYNRRVARI